MISKKRWKFILDMGLNIGAVSAPIAILQLIIYPYLAKQLSAEEYGLMITMYSMWIVVSNSLGNVLNNIRLLRSNEYEENSLQGDFPLILYKWWGINVIIILFASIFYLKGFFLVDILLSILIATLILLKSYFEVGFRIKLNYVAILLNGLLQSCGFIIGLFVFRFTGVWQSVFIFGFLFSSCFTILKTDMLKEQPRKTILYDTVNRDVNLYTVATFSNSSMSYADKLVLYPLMGGHVVSIYYTATILGKIVSMVSGPITSVILSYISKWEKGKKNIFSKVLFLGGVLAVVGYFITMLISRPVIQLLFPQWLGEVMVYLPITTVAIVIQTLNSFLNPFVLKFYDIKWQIVINIISVFSYFLGALLLWNFFGMIGFCVGTVIGHATKTIIMILLYFFDKKKIQAD